MTEQPAERSGPSVIVSYEEVPPGKQAALPLGNQPSFTFGFHPHDDGSYHAQLVLAGGFSLESMPEILEMLQGIVSDPEVAVQIEAASILSNVEED